MAPELINDVQNILKDLFDQKKVAILKLFLHNKNKEFYLQEVSKKTNVPIATTFRILRKLIKARAVQQMQISRLKLYKLNETNENKEQLRMLAALFEKEKTAMDYVLDELKTIPNVISIIMHGEETDKKAGILLVGENIDSEKVKLAEVKIKEKYDFTLLTLVTTQEHFDHLQKNKLISGEIKVLYQKTSSEETKKDAPVV